MANGKEAIFGFPQDVIRRHSFDEYQSDRENTSHRDLARHSLDCDQSLDKYINKLGPHVYEEDEFVRCRMTGGRQVVFVDDSQKSYRYQSERVKDNESLTSSSDDVERTPIERVLLYISRAVLRFYNTRNHAKEKNYVKEKTSQNEVAKGLGLSPASTSHVRSSSTLSSINQAEPIHKQSTTSLELTERESNKKSRAAERTEKAEKEKV